ncbi:hypothetical protein ACVFVO_01430 [Advenella kashmirensis]
MTGYTRQPLRRLNDYTVRVFEWAGNGLLDLVIKKHHGDFQTHDSKRLFDDNSVVWLLRLLFQSIAVYITSGPHSAKNEQKNAQMKPSCLALLMQRVSAGKQDTLACRQAIPRKEQLRAGSGAQTGSERRQLKPGAKARR